jgi:hypothetical protein
MYTLEVVIEVAYVAVAAVESDLLYWLPATRHQFSRSGHPYVSQVSSKRCPDLTVEQAKHVRF